MSAAETEVLLETVERLFAALAAAPGAGGSALAGWERIEELGLGSLLVPESAGGFGGSWQAACEVLRLAGRFGIALPLAETLIARAQLAAHGIEAPAGALTLAGEGSGVLAGAPDRWEFSGTLEAVPWGAACGHVLAEAHRDGRVCLVLLPRTAARAIDAGRNLAAEPRDRLRFERARPAAVAEGGPLGAGSLFALGAFARVAASAGALQAILEQTVEHTNQRVQFGRPLSQFQVIQQQLALLAEDAAAVACAALAAARALDVGDADFEIAAAKLRANRAIGSGTSIAHQCHGAIGVTHEHGLHRFTQRLWSWRSEFGNDRHWAHWLGERVVRAGALWPLLTERGDRS